MKWKGAEILQTATKRSSLWRYDRTEVEKWKVDNDQRCEEVHDGTNFGFRDVLVWTTTLINAVSLSFLSQVQSKQNYYFISVVQLRVSILYTVIIKFRTKAASKK
jgi:hypothetical protein